jgi:hypothetical protein
VRVRIFMLPVQSWATLPRTTLKNTLHVYDTTSDRVQAGFLLRLRSAAPTHGPG